MKLHFDANFSIQKGKYNEDSKAASISIVASSTAGIVARLVSMRGNQNRRPSLPSQNGHVPPINTPTRRVALTPTERPPSDSISTDQDQNGSLHSQNAIEAIARNQTWWMNHQFAALQNTLLNDSPPPSAVIHAGPSGAATTPFTPSAGPQVLCQFGSFGQNPPPSPFTPFNHRTPPQTHIARFPPNLQFVTPPQQYGYPPPNYAYPPPPPQHVPNLELPRFNGQDVERYLRVNHIPASVWMTSYEVHHPNPTWADFTETQHAFNPHQPYPFPYSSPNRNTTWSFPPVSSTANYRLSNPNTNPSTTYRPNRTFPATEQRDRHARSLCIHCAEPYSSNHVCKQPVQCVNEPNPFISSRSVSTQSPMKPPRFVSVPDSGISSLSKPDDGAKFSLVSYNILAQAYVRSNFPHSPSACLNWKARSQAILSVLKNLGADFLCLQEVDEYESFYKRNMESSGYSSTYIQRRGKRHDGCGIFYKHNMAELVMEDFIDYNDLVDSIQGRKVLGVDIKYDEEASANKNGSNKNDRGDPNDPCIRLKRDCVGLIAAFKFKGPSQNVVILANTHIYWDPDWEDVKLAQAKYLISRLSQFKKLISDKFGCTPLLLIAGDFNSTPGDKVYQYLISGNCSSSPTLDVLEDLPIPLCSVYASTRGEPPFTNYTPGFTGTLDYIFFSPSDQIQPVSFLELPEPESSDISGGLPNFNHPSDHLPIGAEFVISWE
ncbi:carbon catabolite repressor protein 4 homolog 6 isoform X2 [Argentina anserina]|uniref:carbon catabolite repressor protein 4 homolog 6 isoform X2 n=1 Tax=Argentina anserina TaxID=57926 RepID=UPI00217692B7|nr:carbon catabolite repressor protein 4 homolog 6 isoform X2 [Potentilla anserina]